ncbi:MAG: PilZ domain-containing protein [Desulfobacteraceae bacterium]|nr:PilZ domain-containing protein [Desulfobacteraceae bacterium]
MKTLVVIVNIIQLGIILMLLFFHGLSLGGPTIFLFFVLMIFPFINFLALMIVTTPAADQNVPVSVEKKSLVKRSAFRLNYHNIDPKPVFIVKGTTFEVQDISKSGLRFIAGHKLRYRQKLKGNLALLCGERLAIRGKVVRIQDHEIGLMFQQDISDLVIETEHRFIKSAHKSKA